MATGFLFGGNTGETAESLARKRAVAEALLANANSSVPQTIGDGIAAIGQALSGRLGLNALNKKEAAGRAAVSDRIRQALTGVGGPSSASASSGIPMTDAASEITAGKPIDMTGNQVYSDFINTVKTGAEGLPGVTNPYGLAAVAATGNAESGFSPGNVNRTWSDPSQSGQPGTAGGIMSWRGPRYSALAATGDLSPTGQAKFFLKEDPNLIAALNNAKSLEEAQGLMNSAWAFAGHDQPGGAETRRRMGFATSYLPSFQGGGSEVASLDPKAGVSSPQAAIQAVAPASGYVDPQVTTAARASAPARNQQVAQALTAPAPSSGPIGVNPELFDVLNDPYIAPGQSAVVRALIDNSLQEQQAARERAAKLADPGYQVDLRLKNAQLDQITNPKMSPAEQANVDLNTKKFEFEKGKPTEVGGRLIGPDGKVIYEAPGKWQKLDDGSLFNESTGEFRMAPKPEGQSGFRFKGSSVEAQALNGLMDSGTLTEDQAQQLGAGKTVSGPNGEIIFMTPQGVFSGNPKEGTAKPLQPQAQPAEQPYVDLFGNGGGEPAPAPVPAPAPAAPEATEPPQRQGMIPLTSPKVTIDESKAAGFADRMNEAEALIQKYGAAGAGVKDQFVSDNAYIPDVAENWLMSDDFQNFAQARRNFINAQLRRESGAVIGPSEFENARKQYFPEPGDNDEVLKQKAQNRQTAIQAMVRDAGPTYGKKKPTDEPAPDFSKMSDEELQRYIDGR